MILVALGLVTMFTGLIISFITNDNLFLKLLSLLLGLSICFTLIGFDLHFKSIEDEKNWNIFLDRFNGMNCEEKGDEILKQYMYGNTTTVSKSLQYFTDAGCKFDLATSTLLKAVPEAP